MSSASNPYIVTTKRPGYRTVNEVCGVATLLNAQEYAYWEWRRVRKSDDPYPDDQALRRTLESGEAVTLPDGTVIEVEATTWGRLAETLDRPWWSSVFVAIADSGDSESQQKILDAYNARQ